MPRAGWRPSIKTDCGSVADMPLVYLTASVLVIPNLIWNPVNNFWPCQHLSNWIPGIASRQAVFVFSGKDSLGSAYDLLAANQQARDDGGAVKDFP